MTKKVLILGLITFSSIALASSLLKNPQLMNVTNKFIQEDLKIVEKEIINQCLVSWTNNQNLPIFSDLSENILCYIPLKTITAKNVKFTSQCLADNPNF